ncbi:MAG TPA: hypothetical protein VJ276_05520 [Thermoanaerobaculia bacterium]|nr:hypothetical protein [Thermoanaerobaculia bacterium]
MNAIPDRIHVFGDGVNLTWRTVNAIADGVNLTWRTVNAIRDGVNLTWRTVNAIRDRMDASPHAMRSTGGGKRCGQGRVLAYHRRDANIVGQEIPLLAGRSSKLLLGLRWCRLSGDRRGLALDVIGASTNGRRWSMPHAFRKSGVDVYG